MNHTHKAKKIGFPACTEIATTDPLTNNWKMVSCPNCLALDRHKWHRGFDIISCIKCGLIKGSGYTKCDQEPT